MDRRTFSKIVTLGIAGSRFPALLQGATKRTLKIGHTGLTWVKFERTPSGTTVGNPLANVDFIQQAAKDIAGQGFWGTEYFSAQVEAMESKGGIGTLLREYNLPLTSAYCPVNLSDPDKRNEAVANFTRWGKLVKKYGGTVLVIGPNQVKRDSFKFSEHKANILAALNDLGKAANDVGLMAVLHQHTGTCVETRDETYETLEGMDTRYVKFGPDIGQLQKGGVDPVQVLKDFLPLVHHMHLKDYSGGEHYLGYCPLGQGKVDLAAILDLMEGRKIAGHVMVELDGSAGQPLTPVETAKVARTYLESVGAPMRKAS